LPSEVLVERADLFGLGLFSLSQPGAAMLRPAFLIELFPILHRSPRFRLLSCAAE